MGEEDCIFVKKRCGMDLSLALLYIFLFNIPIGGIGILLFLNNTILDTTGDAMKDVILRLKRVGGQVEGLVRMIERDEECSQIITQFQAAKAALDNTFSLVLQRNLKQCMSQDDSKSVERILQLIAK